MKHFIFSFVLFSIFNMNLAQAANCTHDMPEDLCRILEELDQRATQPRYGWSRPADRQIGIPSVNNTKGLSCYDLIQGGQPKNPDLCREVAPTSCEWGEDNSGRTQCYEHYQGQMVGRGPINGYLCRQPSLCTRENLRAEDRP